MDYPDIVAQDLHDNELQLMLSIDANLDAFEGHFDQFPVVPGVTQIAWAKYYFSNLLAPKLKISRHWQVQKMTTLKFQQVMTPNNQVQLTLSFDHNRECFTFSFYNSQHQFSSGKIFVSPPRLTD